MFVVLALKVFKVTYCYGYNCLHLHKCSHVCKGSMCMQYLERPEGGVRSTGTGATDGCSITMWAMETERGPSVRAVSALNH